MQTGAHNGETPYYKTSENYRNEHLHTLIQGTAWWIFWALLYRRGTVAGIFGRSKAGSYGPLALLSAPPFRMLYEGKATVHAA